jgi:hypothetical protein
MRRCENISARESIGNPLLPVQYYSSLCMCKARILKVPNLGLVRCMLLCVAVHCHVVK